MYFNVSIKSAVRISFYLILIGVSASSLIKLLEESTALEEKVIYNKARLPSFTLCPMQPDDAIINKSIFVREKKSLKNLRVLQWTFWNQTQVKNWLRRVASCPIVCRDWLWKYDFGTFWGTVIHQQIFFLKFSLLILGGKSCFLGPTVFEIPQPNWY